MYILVGNSIIAHATIKKITVSASASLLIKYSSNDSFHHFANAFIITSLSW